jgi:hypothetical protein
MTLKDRLEEKELNESGLSRIWKHMENHDCGLLTAFRHAKACGKGDVYTKEENLKRNKSMLAKLQAKRYGVTSVKGSYIENFGSSDEKEVGENVFFVVDTQDTGKLKEDLVKLGKEFEQDSILYIPKGGESSVLIGTNACPNGYPGLGKTVTNDKRVLGKSGQFFTRIKGRPFTFESTIYETHDLPQGYMGRMSCNRIADKKWFEIE